MAVTKSQRPVERILAERQDEISAHHAKHHLEPTHHYRHKRKRTVNEAISLDLSSSPQNA